MKKQFLFTVLFALVANQIIAQDRVNRPKQEFSQSSAKFEKATGWAYNKEEGVWVEYQNIVSKDTYKNYPSLKGGDYHKSNEYNTFEYLQFKKFVYQEQIFYILLIDKIEGSYRYPSIREDWEEYPVLRAYVFVEEEFNKLKNNQTCTSTYSISTGRYDYKLGEGNILDKLYTALSENKIVPSKYSTYTMKVRKTDDGKSIRFLLPEYESSYSPRDFENNYFEVGEQIFQQLFILN